MISKNDPLTRNTTINYGLNTKYESTYLSALKSEKLADFGKKSNLKFLGFVFFLRFFF